MRLIEYVGGKIWLAMPEAKLKVGEEYYFLFRRWRRRNFKSETLNRTFDQLIFTTGPVVLPGTEGTRLTRR